MDVHETLPLIPVREVVVFPYMMMPFVIGRPSSVQALEHALMADKRIFLAAQHDAAVDDPEPTDIFTMGCVAKIVNSVKLADGDTKVLVEGIERACAVEWKEGEGFFRVVVKIVPKHKEMEVDAAGTMSSVVSLFEQYVTLSDNLHYDAMIPAVRVNDPGKLADTIAALLLISVNQKQELLEIVSPAQRLHRLEGVLETEIVKLEIHRRFQRRLNARANERRRDLYLRETRRVIRTDIEELKRRVEAPDMTPSARSAVARSLERLEILAKMPDNALAVPKDLDWPIVREVSMESSPHSREVERPFVERESRSAESGEATKELKRSEPEPELNPQPTVTIWVAVGAGMVGGALIATVQWLIGWYSR
jgi:ATP-dependent Lon protease